MSIRVCRGILPTELCTKITRMHYIDSRIRDGRGGNADGDCGRVLVIVKACDAALIRERMLSERSEFILSLIAFSRITGLLL